MAINFFRNRTISPEHMGEVRSFAIQTGSCHQIGARDEQQDSFRIIDSPQIRSCPGFGILAVIADGMGGLSNGSKFSAAAIDCVQYFDKYYHQTGDDASLLLMHLLAEAKNQIDISCSQHNGSQRALGGTTFLAVTVIDERLNFISVGDSRVYLMRGDTLIQLNREHVYSVELDNDAIRGKITFEMARSDPQRRALTSYLGTGNIALIDRSVSSIRLLPKDYILLMTDGVFGTLSEGEIIAAVSGNAVESARRLEKAVLQKSRPNQDNFTAIVIACL